MPESGEEGEEICCRMSDTSHWEGGQLEKEKTRKEKGWMKSNHGFFQKFDLCTHHKAEAPKEPSVPRGQCILDWPYA